MNSSLKYSLIFGALGAIFFLPFLGGVNLFDWDEINFAEISREMIMMDDFLRVHIDFKPFWEKPPFFFWLQSITMLAVGVNEYAARLPNAICGILTLIILFNIGNKLYNTKFGIVWAGIYLGTVLPHLYFKSGIIDPWFNLFIFLGLYFMILSHWHRKHYPGILLNHSATSYILLAGLLVGLAILTKGPVAYLIVVLTCFVYWAVNRFKKYISVKHIVLFTTISFIPMLVWYGMQIFGHGTLGIEEFIRYQHRLLSTADAGHRGFLGYHFIVLLIGCFPASIFCIRSFFKTEQEFAFQHDLKKWMVILFWVVLILFTLVKSKIIHYSSLCYFPITFLAALSVVQIIEGRVRFNNWMKGGLIVIAIIYGLATILSPFVAKNIEKLKPLIKDPFVVANLDAPVQWTGFEGITGILIIAATIAGIYLIQKGRKETGFKVLFGGTAIYTMLTLIFFMGKIEAYSQRAAVDFYKGLEGKDCYVAPWGYKSYAHLFYTNKEPPKNEKANKIDWLINGEIDKDVYLVAKIHQCKELKERKDIKEITAKNGFILFRRETTH